jgi:integrase
MPDAPKDSRAFLAAYLAATGDTPKIDRKPTPGTVGALVTGFKASAAYQNLAESTRAYIRRNLDAIRTTWGDAPAADLDARHIRFDLSKLDPNPANMRLRAWKAMCKWAFQEAALLDKDPAAPVRKRVVPKTEGFAPWTREDVAAFRAHWPHDTEERMTFEVLHRTAAAVVDACQIGPAMVRDGWLFYTRRKSGSPAVCPMTAETSPPWFEHDDHLALCIAAQPARLVYLMTKTGKARSHKSVSQWFAAACRAAGIEGKSAHGLRKHRAAVFKENGASAEQRMAILGHETASEAKDYAASASLARTVWGTPISNLPDQAKPYGAEILVFKGGNMR